MMPASEQEIPGAQERSNEGRDSSQDTTPVPTVIIPPYVFPESAESTTAEASRWPSAP